MNEARIGIFICNYNKKQYVLDNLRSLSKQTIRDQLDIYVIDNASTDGAPDAIEDQFPFVEVVRNGINKGGAGGFCQALKMGERLGYKYILLADNDITLASDVIEQLYTFLGNHADVGMVGAKIYLMDDPDRIWIYGNWIDFENYRMIDGFSNELDSEKQPEVVYCDTVPSCCSLIRTECLKKTGYMPEPNFISWDDIEWCYRFGRAGYKVAAISAAKVWHKTGGKVLNSHFSTYYYNRNKLHFFAKYISHDKIHDYTEKMLADFFTRIYGLAQKGCANNVTSLMYAFTDFMYLVRGKAEDKKILPYDRVENLLFAAVQDFSCVKIQCPCDSDEQKQQAVCHALHNVLGILKDEKKTIVEFQGDQQSVLYFKERYEIFGGNPYEETCEGAADGIKLTLCSHVTHVETYVPGEIYIDEWCNVIADGNDYHYFRNYDYAKRNFAMMYRSLFTNAVFKIREDEYAV